GEAAARYGWASAGPGRGAEGGQGGGAPGQAALPAGGGADPGGRAGPGARRGPGAHIAKPVRPGQAPSPTGLSYTNSLFQGYPGGGALPGPHGLFASGPPTLPSTPPDPYQQLNVDNGNVTDINDNRSDLSCACEARRRPSSSRCARRRRPANAPPQVPGSPPDPWGTPVLSLPPTTPVSPPAGATPVPAGIGRPLSVPPCPQGQPVSPAGSRTSPPEGSLSHVGSHLSLPVSHLSHG
ncbi:uncharacterized protein VK521_017605, partial [Ammospiza maritima maritima]